MTGKRERFKGVFIGSGGRSRGEGRRHSVCEPKSSKNRETGPLREGPSKYSRGLGRGGWQKVHETEGNSLQ